MLNNREDVNIELIDIDDVIVDYITKFISIPFTDSSGASIDSIKVEFKNPERWAKLFYPSSEKDQSQELNDLPAIILNRSNIQILKDRMPHWLNDADLEYLVTTSSKPSFNPNGTVTYKYSRRPVSIEASYDVTIVSKYKQHSDHITQQFILHESKFWTSEWYGIRVRYTDISDSSTVGSTTEERLIRHTFTITVDGFILPKKEHTEFTLKVVSPIAKINLEISETTYDEFVKKYGR